MFMDEKQSNIPEWDILTTTNGFNMKAFYALATILITYLLNIVITIITVINTNNNSLPDIGMFFIVSTILSFILTITAIILGHKSLKEIKTTREKGRFFAYGALSASYISITTLGLVFIVMDIMFIALFLK